MRKRIGAIGAVAIVVTVAAGCSGAEAPPAATAGPMATVDGSAISEAAYQARMATVTSNADVKTAMRDQAGVRERLSADVLGLMIDAKLIELGEKRFGVRVTDRALQSYVDKITRDYLGGGPDAWQKFLEDKGYPEAEVLQQLREDLRREKIENALAGGVRVTDREISQMYEQQYRGRSNVRHILVATEQQAGKLIARLRAGADFGGLAKAYSLDKASASQGGALGPYIRGQYVASFEEAVEQAEDGELLGPIASPFGFHVIERMAPSTLEEIRPTLTTKLRESKQDKKFDTWLARLRSKADVTLRADLGTWDATTGKIKTA